MEPFSHYPPDQFAKTGSERTQGNSKKRDVSRRGIGQTLSTPLSYRRLLAVVPSHYNACEFCQGTVAQMLDGGAFVSDAIEEFGPQIAYVHFRNVQGAKKSHF